MLGKKYKTRFFQNFFHSSFWKKAALLCCGNLMAGLLIMPVDATPVATGAAVRAFLGNVNGKLVYTKWEGTTGYDNGTSLWYVDISSDAALVEKQVIQGNSEPKNAIISDDGNWIVYNDNANKVYICQLKENSTRISICDGAQPVWWKNQTTGKEYIICTGKDMMGSWQNVWQDASVKDNTYIQEINPTTKQPIGSRQTLIANYANGGRSRNGGWLFSSGRATGIYQIDSLAVSNATIIKTTPFTTEWGCNPSISPANGDNLVLVLHNGAADKSTLGFEEHTYFVIRKTDGTIVSTPQKNPGDGNAYTDAPQWSTHVNYASFVASAQNNKSPYDVYLFRMTDNTSLRVLDGNYFWPHLWVSGSPGTVGVIKPHVRALAGSKQKTVVRVGLGLGAQSRLLCGNEVVYDIRGRKISTPNINDTQAGRSATSLLLYITHADNN